MAGITPQKQLETFIAKFSSDVGSVARASLRTMESRLPSATRLVYDNYNALAIGFGPSERASDAIFSIAVYPRWVSLFFFGGVDLPDPQRVLKGSGTQARHIVLQSAADLEKSEVQALMQEALKRADLPLPSRGKGTLIIKSVSAKQRPRRPAAAAKKR